MVPRRAVVVAISVALLVGTLLLFARSWGNEFVNYDDNDYVTANTHVTGGLTATAVRWAFATGEISYWHPLTWLSFMLDASFFGADATGGPHIVNAILHGLNSILVLLLLRKLTGKMHESALAALVFAVHPLRVESVVWLAERKDVLCTFFSLLSLWLYAQYASKPFHAARYAAFAVAGMCAMMAKPMAVTLPFVMLLLDWWPFARVRAIGKCIAEKIPLVAFAGFTSWQIMQSKIGRAHV